MPEPPDNLVDDAPLPPPPDEDEPPLTFTTDEDWSNAMSNLRERRQANSRHAPRAAADGYYDDDDDDEDALDSTYSERDRAPPRISRRTCWVTLGSFLVSALIVSSYQLWMWFHPTPVSCDLDLVRPQKFKVDVTDFFVPKVSAALQLVLSLRNGNMLRSMLLEHCKLTAYETETGLKLGSTQQGSLVLSPLQSTKVTLSLPGLGSSLPPPEQRRLASTFLAKKALLLTIVATASSRLPVKGSKASSVSTNSSKRVDLSALTKEPFFQRAPAPQPEPPADGTPTKPHDVPV